MRRKTNASKSAARRRVAVLDVLEQRTLLSGTAPSLLGYFPDYEVADHPSLIKTLSNTQFQGLTQINYFSVVPTTTGLLPGTSVGGVSNTSTTTSGGYSLTGSSSQLDTLVTAAHAQGVKVDVTIGGGGSQSGNLTSVVEGGAAVWQTFAASVQQFATAHGIDGVDLDWEPASLGAADQADYGSLIAALKAGTTGLTLSAAVNSEKLQVSTGGSAYVLNATGVQDLTTINVMAYDLLPGNTSPIGQAETDLNGWNSYVVTAGGNKHQIIFGMPFYGTSGTTWANTIADQYGDLVAKNGSLPSPSANSVVISGVTWNYNGPTTIGAKVAYALDQGDGGALTWEIGQDYFTSSGGYDSTYSLLPQFSKAAVANTGTISGTVSTTGGTPVAGETVYLDSNGNGLLDAGEPTTTTNAAGAYSFSELLIGTYSVREVFPSGYTQTSPAAGAAISAVATAGGTVTANFTVMPPLPSYITASAGAAYLWNPSTGSLTLTGGTLTFTSDAAADTTDKLMNLTGNGASASFVFNTSQHLAGLTLQNGAVAKVASLGAARTHSNHNVLVIGSLNSVSDPTFSVATSSKLDLADNDLIIHTGSSDSTGKTELGIVQAAAAQGRNVSPGGVYDGTWTGNGLTSSTAASVDAAAGYEQNVLAVELNSDMFLGGYGATGWVVGSDKEPVGTNDVLVKYTYNGDLNLDGAVDGNAATIFSTFFDGGASTQNDSAFGDLNGDGKVDGNDATIFSTVFGNGTVGSGLPQL